MVYRRYVFRLARPVFGEDDTDDENPQANIPFKIFERDEHVSSRGQGWAITIHWALPYLREMLSTETLDLIDESCQVDPEVGRHDTGNFLFINLETMEPKFRIPPNERRRVNREKLRKVLLEGVKEHVHWSKHLFDIREDSTDSVTAIFADGSEVVGSFIVGVEGNNSRVRRLLCPETYKTTQLPVRFLGSAVDMTPSEVAPLRALDPILFQGCHPVTGTFLWVSMLETPAGNGTKGADERYRVQINLSWPVRGPDDELKPSDAERMAEMKKRAQCFAAPLREAVESMPDDAPVLEIVLADWPCLQWPTNSRVTLAGDAAHAMTMYRGEAANHGFLDAYYLSKSLRAIQEGDVSQKCAIEQYELEMRARTSRAVLLSREACLDAHDWNGLNENSAVLKRRQITDDQ